MRTAEKLTPTTAIVSSRTRISRGPVVALVLLSVFAAALWLHGLHYGLVPCFMDCGETFVAKQQVAQFERYGFAYNLIQDHATSDDLAAHPYLYTHNVSIPGLLFPVMRWLGVEADWAFQLVSLAATLIGLIYVYMTVAYFTRSSAIGCLTLALFVTDYLHVFSFGLNALRAWHWLALFGLLYHTGRLMDPRCRNRWTQRVVIALLAIISFGIGYDYWVICGAVSGLLILFLLPREGKPARLASEYGWLATAFMLPFIARQIHMALSLGWTFFREDFLITAAIKVPFLTNLIELPEPEELDNLYHQLNILRAPASPAQDLGSILTTAKDMLHVVLVPSYGVPTLLTFVAMVALSLLLVASLAIVRRTKRATGTKGAPEQATSAAQSMENFRRSAILLLALTGGVAIGISIFAPLSLHIYVKHQFPLIAGPLLLNKALLLGAITLLFLRTRATRHQALRWGWLVILLFLVADHILIQIRHFRETRPMSTEWTSAVTARANDNFVVSWFSDSVDAYASGWSVAILPGTELEIARRIRGGEAPFRIDDYFLFGQRDGATKRAVYERPRYWLYFPVDHMTNFDSVHPACSSDLWVALVGKLTSFNTDAPEQGRLWTRKSSVVPPGSHFIIGGKIIGPDPAAVSRVEIVDENGLVTGTVNFNCIYSTFAALMRVPEGELRSEVSLKVRVVYINGDTFPLGEVKMLIDPSSALERPQDLMPWARQPQPSPDELAAMIPNVPVVARGKNFVMFDLKTTYGSARP